MPLFITHQLVLWPTVSRQRFGIWHENFLERNRKGCPDTDCPDGEVEKGEEAGVICKTEGCCATLWAVSHLWAVPSFPKALQIATETNCITEYLQESETQLRKAKVTGKLGLLYGVPVSIKDSINCQVQSA